MYEGLLIKESLNEESILDLIEIKNVEIWKTENHPKYWTAIHFSSLVDDFPERLSKVLIDNPLLGESWYVDMKKDNIKYIVLKNNVLTYKIGDDVGKLAVMEQCRKFGIPEQQLDWKE